MTPKDTTIMFTFQNSNGERVYFYGDAPRAELTLSGEEWVALGSPGLLDVTVKVAKDSVPLGADVREIPTATEVPESK